MRHSIERDLLTVVRGRCSWLLSTLGGPPHDHGRNSSRDPGVGGRNGDKYQMRERYRYNVSLEDKRKLCVALCSFHYNETSCQELYFVKFKCANTHSSNIHYAV